MHVLHNTAVRNTAYKSLRMHNSSYRESKPPLRVLAKVCIDLVESVHKGKQVAAGGAGRITAQRAADVAQRARCVSREQHLRNWAVSVPLFFAHFSFGCLVLGLTD